MVFTNLTFAVHDARFTTGAARCLFAVDRLVLRRGDVHNTSIVELRRDADNLSRGITSEEHSGTSAQLATCRDHQFYLVFGTGSVSDLDQVPLSAASRSDEPTARMAGAANLNCFGPNVSKSWRGLKDGFVPTENRGAASVAAAGADGFKS